MESCRICLQQSLCCSSERRSWCGLTGAPVLNLSHLARLCDDTGLIEHAWLSVPRRESGYTTDDNGRMLVVLARVDWSTVGKGVAAEGTRLTHLGLSYLKHAARPEGHGFRNRMSYGRRFLDTKGSDDSYGRALWGLGTLAARTNHSELREAAHSLFWSNYTLRSGYSRSVAYALLGAAEMATLDGSATLRRQIRVWLDQLPKAGKSREDDAWLWPEERLTYDNARLPEAMIQGGRALNDSELIARGMSLLEWLIEAETSRDDGHFSFTPVGGAGPHDPRPGFDQQPLEAWGMMDACSAAAAVNGGRWLEEARKAADWFTGRNDINQSLVDMSTGAGFDGLTPTGPNRNQGAESTLAALAAATHSTAGFLRRSERADKPAK